LRNRKRARLAPSNGASVRRQSTGAASMIAGKREVHHNLGKKGRTKGEKLKEGGARDQPRKKRRELRSRGIKACFETKELGPKEKSFLGVGRRKAGVNRQNLPTNTGHLKRKEGSKKKKMKNKEKIPEESVHAVQAGKKHRGSGKRKVKQRAKTAKHLPKTRVQRDLFVARGKRKKRRDLNPNVG